MDIVEQRINQHAKDVQDGTTWCYICVVQRKKWEMFAAIYVQVEPLARTNISKVHYLSQTKHLFYFPFF